MTGAPGAEARATGPDIRVRGDTIEALGRLAPEPGERVIDATDCVVYPGWVNTHHHLFQSLLKGVPGGINLPLVPWLGAVPSAYRRHFDANLLRIAAEIGLAEMVLSGTTTVADHHYLYYPGIPYDGAAILFDAAERFGVRFALLRGGNTVRRAFDGSGDPHLEPEPLDAFLADVERLVGRFHQRGPRALRQVVMAPTTPTWSCPPGELKAFARAARSLGIRLHSHLSETADYVRYCRERYDTTPVEFVARHEWLGADVWFAHMVHVSPSEIPLLAESKTGVSHCPQSNCRLGSGIAPVPAYAKAGVPVSLAVDGAASNEAADMIGEAHTAWSIHRAVGGADAVTVEDVVHWGTQGGARILGLDEVGAIAPGLAADLVIYSLDHPRYAGLHDPAVGPVVAGGAAHVKHALCAGKTIVEDGAIPGFDLERLAHEARAAVRRMAV